MAPDALANPANPAAGNGSPPRDAAAPRHSLRDHVASHGRLEGADLFRMAQELAALVHDLHERGAVHGDIRPARVLLPDGLRPELGPAAGLVAADRGADGYAAPERRVGEPGDARSDLFGLGATLYFAATGQDPAPLRADLLPADLRPIVIRCLQSERQQRFASTEELRAALRAAERSWIAQDLVERAGALIDRGRFDEAEQLLASAAAEPGGPDPGALRVRLQRRRGLADGHRKAGRVAVAAGELENAVAAYEALARVVPGDHEAREELARLRPRLRDAQLFRVEQEFDDACAAADYPAARQLHDRLVALGQGWVGSPDQQRWRSCLEDCRLAGLEAKKRRLPELLPQLGDRAFGNLVAELADLGMSSDELNRLRAFRAGLDGRRRRQAWLGAGLAAGAALLLFAFVYMPNANQRQAAAEAQQALDGGDLKTVERLLAGASLAPERRADLAAAYALLRDAAAGAPLRDSWPGIAALRQLSPAAHQRLLMDLQRRFVEQLDDSGRTQLRGSIDQPIVLPIWLVGLPMQMGGRRIELGADGAMPWSEEGEFQFTLFVGVAPDQFKVELRMAIDLTGPEISHAESEHGEVVVRVVDRSGIRFEELEPQLTAAPWRPIAGGFELRLQRRSRDGLNLNIAAVDNFGNRRRLGIAVEPLPRLQHAAQIEVGWADSAFLLKGRIEPPPAPGSAELVVGGRSTGRLAVDAEGRFAFQTAAGGNFELRVDDAPIWSTELPSHPLVIEAPSAVKCWQPLADFVAAVRGEPGGALVARVDGGRPVRVVPMDDQRFRVEIEAARGETPVRLRLEDRFGRSCEQTVMVVRNDALPAIGPARVPEVGSAIALAVTEDPPFTVVGTSPPVGWRLGGAGLSCDWPAAWCWGRRYELAIEVETVFGRRGTLVVPVLAPPPALPAQQLPRGMSRPHALAAIGADGALFIAAQNAWAVASPRERAAFQFVRLEHPFGELLPRGIAVLPGSAGAPDLVCLTGESGRVLIVRVADQQLQFGWWSQPCYSEKFKRQGILGAVALDGDTVVALGNDGWLSLVHRDDPDGGQRRRVDNTAPASGFALLQRRAGERAVLVGRRGGFYVFEVLGETFGGRTHVPVEAWRDQVPRQFVFDADGELRWAITAPLRARTLVVWTLEAGDWRALDRLDGDLLHAAALSHGDGGDELMVVTSRELAVLRVEESAQRFAFDDREQRVAATSVGRQIHVLTAQGSLQGFRLP